MDWVAHSFLCVIRELGSASCEVGALLGFGWGFSIRAEDIAIERPAPLSEREWNGHLPLLRAHHPEWRFAAGYENR